MLETIDIPTSTLREDAAETDYHSLNAMINFYGPDGELQLQHDKEAVRQYFLQHVNRKTEFRHDLEEKISYLLDKGYYEREVFDQYEFPFVKALYKQAYAHKFRFSGYLGALKFYESYALKSFDGETYLERFEDRVVLGALTLAQGDKDQAKKLVDAIISGRFQPATPTFLNAGRKQRGELVSCYLVRTEDSMESISRNINNALQLSKRGGGVALNLTNIREFGAPIKKIQNQSSGIVPVMKLLEDSFSYANQLGARQGAGAVYLNAHHPEILTFLDTKRENADEKIRIKTLSLGVIVPDITFELASKDKEMYLFSPYDIQRIYGVAMSDISVTEKYDEMVANPEIKKSKISARGLLQAIAEVQFESGYPYILFEDVANRSNPIAGRISMSNLCSEILQVSEPSTFNEDLSYNTVGKDISCNLGSMNIAKVMDAGDIAGTVEVAIRALTAVSEMSNIASVPSIDRGNDLSHAVGLGQMNLASFLGRELIHYGSEEGIDFTGTYFYTVLFHALNTSNKIARERNETFGGFENSTYASGEFFTKYIEEDWRPTTKRITEMFETAGISIPGQDDWRKLAARVKKSGLFNQNLQAVPPTGSISYINNSSASIHPITAQVEIRKEGKVGRTYFPAPYMNDSNREFFLDAYEVGPEKIIDTYAAAAQHVDQGLSLTLFFKDSATTADIIKAQGRAWRKGCKTIYYIRIRQDSLDGVDQSECVSCQL